MYHITDTELTNIENLVNCNGYPIRGLQHLKGPAVLVVINPHAENKEPHQHIYLVLQNDEVVAKISHNFGPKL